MLLLRQVTLVKKCNVKKYKQIFIENCKLGHKNGGHMSKTDGTTMKINL